MKVLTLTQPWATLVAIEEKRIETRSWATSYRGPLLIHAAKTMPRWCRELAEEEPFCDVLNAHAVKNLPLGSVLCETTLENCLPTEQIREAWCYYSEAVHEEQFGDYAEGRFGFILGEIYRKFSEGIEVRGALSLWEFPDERYTEELRKRLWVPA